VATDDQVAGGIPLQREVLCSPGSRKFYDNVMDYKCDSSGQQVSHDQALTVAPIRVMCTTTLVK
jgi:hypothetical protein